MGKYKAPKARLHRDFVYLDFESVLNSLSAFEAGQVDEIIEKTRDATNGQAEGSLRLGIAKVGGSQQRTAEMQEELVRKRTRFSAFEGWHQRLQDHDAIGSFDEWDLEVREALRVGHTIEFDCRVRLSPLHLALATFSAYAREASPTSSMFKVTREAAAEARNTAKMMEGWITGADGSRLTLLYFEPTGAATAAPRIVGRVSDSYLIRGLGELDGIFSVVAQVEAVLRPSDEVSVVRVMRDAPPTPLETRTIVQAMANMQGGATEALGIELRDDDISFLSPVVMIRPIAIFR